MSQEPSRGYTLELSEPERMRYRMMAGLARENEADLWEYAGIVPGARVADVGLTIEHFRYYAGWATKLEGETIPVSVPYAPGARFFNYTNTGFVPGLRR